MVAEEKTAQLYLRIPWETHGVLSTLATNYGTSMQQLAVDLLTEAISKMDVPSWYTYFINNRRKQVLTNVFVDRARMCMICTDESELTDALDEADKLGLDTNAILSRASDLAQVGYGVSPNVEEAMKFILDHLDEEGRVSAKDILEEAKKQRISRYSLDEARAALKVVSRRYGKRWIWERTTPNEDDDGDS